jgi:uncharacterized membrane protein
MEILLLRLIHIGAGVFWVGSVLTFHLFIQPAAIAAGPAATGFTYQLLHHQRFSVAILTSGLIAVIAGISLLVITSNGLNPDILFGASRLGFTIGGVVAILSLGVGALYLFPRTRTVEATIGGLLAQGRPPTPAEQELLARTGREARAAGWVVSIGLIVAVICMATASYWSLFL